MARSPLMQVVLRSLRAARSSAALGMPADEFLLSRREALRAAAGTAGAAILGGCAVAPARKEREEPAPRPVGPKVVVVGGGIAGLHCARLLRGMGVVAEVREASGRTGGRMFTDRVTFGAQTCELGGELVDTGHLTMQDLAGEMGLELLDFTTDDSALAPWVAFVGGRSLSEREILDGLAPVLAKVEEARAADPLEVDRLSIREWLDAAGLSGEVRRFVDVAYTTEYGLEPEESSALNFIQMIATDRAKLAVFGDSDERFRFRAGNDSVVERLAAGLDPGQVRLASRLVRIRREPDGLLRLTFDRGAVLGSEEVRADHAVLALPFTLLREVELELELPPLKRRVIAELGYGSNAKIMAGFKERAWRKRGSNGEVFTDLGFQCSWETSRLQEGREGILTNFTGGSHGREIGAGPAAARAEEFVEGLDRVFPGLGDAHDRRAVRMHWPTHPWTKGSYASYRVGQAAAFKGREIARVGNLHFCGEHTSEDAQGFMEGGALTGAMAAVEVAVDLGIAIPPGNRILDRARTAGRFGRWLPSAAMAATARPTRSPRTRR